MIDRSLEQALGLADEASSPTDPWRVLIVDDRPDRRALIRAVLGTVPPPGRQAIAVGEASGLAAASREVLLQAFDAAIVEVQPIEIGLATISALRAASPSLVIVVCSFRSDKATQIQALLSGADSYLIKPVSRRDLLAACQRRSER